MTSSTEFNQDINALYLDQLIAETLPGFVIAICSEVNTINFVAYRQHVPALIMFLKLHSALLANTIVDCYATDTIDTHWRFTITYSFRSSISNYRFNIITKTTDGLALVSLQNIFPGFNWPERELYDLMGIMFLSHPDLRRILTDYGFAGHPLRKDFPLSGFREVQYDEATKCLTHSPIELTQSLRMFNVLSYWQDSIDA